MDFENIRAIRTGRDPAPRPKIVTAEMPPPVMGYSWYGSRFGYIHFIDYRETYQTYDESGELKFWYEVCRSKDWRVSIMLWRVEDPVDADDVTVIPLKRWTKRDTGIIRRFVTDFDSNLEVEDDVWEWENEDGNYVEKQTFKITHTSIEEGKEYMRTKGPELCEALAFRYNKFKRP